MSVEDWLPYATLSNAASAIAIAAFTAALFYLQRRQNEHAKMVAEANYKFQLFERRLEVYFVTREYCTEFFGGGAPSAEAAARLQDISLSARFLMGDDVQDYLVSLRDHAFEYRKLQRRDGRYQSKINREVELTDEENQQHQDLLDKMQAVEVAVGLLCTMDKLDAVFSPYLKMPDSLGSR